MTQAVTVRRDGDTFQARLFWWHAARLLDPQSPVMRVGFESGPKSFDDIWVEYDPARSAVDQYGDPLRREHMQCKWHVTPDNYGYSNLIDPEFINANARSLLQRAREAQIKGYFHRHGFKILILGRFAVGFRTAAYLTAGILQLPPLKLFLTDLLAASLSTVLMFGLGYIFAHQIESGIREAQQYFTVALAVGVVAFLLYRFYRGRQRAGLPVGPPVLYGEEPPLPPDDLRTRARDLDPEIDSLAECRPASVSSPDPASAQPLAPDPKPSREAVGAGEDGPSTRTPAPQIVEVRVPPPAPAPVASDSR